MDEEENVYKEILKDENKFDVLSELAFEAVDKDKSGKIDQSELEKIMAQICMEMGAEIPSKEDVQEVLNHLDKDHGGDIDKKEFKAFIRDILIGMVEDIDDVKGVIEKEELEEKKQKIMENNKNIKINKID